MVASLFPSSHTLIPNYNNAADIFIFPYIPLGILETGEKAIAIATVQDKIVNKTKLSGNSLPLRSASVLPIKIPSASSSPREQEPKLQDQFLLVSRPPTTVRKLAIWSVVCSSKWRALSLKLLLCLNGPLSFCHRLDCLESIVLRLGKRPAVLRLLAACILSCLELEVIEKHVILVSLLCGLSQLLKER
ncbi:hypothetical protein SDJN03_08446, partial [Cucurbita argyrosperma subsp. sororia]